MRLAIALGIAAGAAILSFRAIYEPDLWWHLAQGREDLSGHFVRTNLFSFTHPDYRQHFTSWLFDTTAYMAWRATGGVGIQLLQASLLALTLTLVHIASRVRAPVVAALAISILGFVVLEPRALPRPYLVSFAAIAACTLLVEQALARCSAAPLRWAVPLVAIWSNFHVECVFGVMLLGAFAIAELVRPSALSRGEAMRAVVLTALCALATLANPYGWGLLRYLYENASVPDILRIAELRPPYLPGYRAFFLYLVVGTVLLISRPRRLTLWEVLVFTAFAGLGLRYVRLTPLAFLVTAPMVAARVGAWMARGLDGRAVAATAIVAALLTSRIPVSILATDLRFGTPAVAPAEFFSPAAIAFARAERLDGPLFNSNNLGGYLAWMLFPEARIYQDSRLQAYPPGHFVALLNASRSQRDWDQLMRSVDWAVLSIPRPNQLSGVGRFQPGEWAIVFWDEAVEVVVRRSRYADLVARREYQFVTREVDPLVLAAKLPGGSAARIRVEALRNSSENPDGFLATAVLCLMDEPGFCGKLDRIASTRPMLRDAAERVRSLTR
jgi:hypothetical protein